MLPLETSAGYQIRATHRLTQRRLQQKISPHGVSLVNYIVRDGRTGLLVPPGDTVALAKALLSVLSDPDTAHEFGVAGRGRAREFTVSSVVERIERMYADAIASRRVSAGG